MEPCDTNRQRLQPVGHPDPCSIHFPPWGGGGSGLGRKIVIELPKNGQTGSSSRKGLTNTPMATGASFRASHTHREACAMPVWTCFLPFSRRKHNCTSQKLNAFHVGGKVQSPSTNVAAIHSTTQTGNRGCCAYRAGCSKAPPLLLRAILSCASWAVSVHLTGGKIGGCGNVFQMGLGPSAANFHYMAWAFCSGPFVCVCVVVAFLRPFWIFYCNETRFDRWFYIGLHFFIYSLFNQGSTVL